MHLQDSFGAPSTISVSTLAQYLKDLLEKNDILQNTWVHGEVSNCKSYPSGHCYFTLKEGESQLPCVFFKHARLRSAAPTLKDGMALAVNGNVSFYGRDGKLQMYVEGVRALGEGVLYRRFEQLKARLEAEGLFEADRKRLLPEQPSIIGIVTSLQAAALRDMLRVLRNRYPLARVVLAPAQVQGADAPASIAAALDLLNEYGEPDVIIAGRGGGSIEELWAFNEEVVARAIARSRIPVISAVGHETDFTIADFVADQRASTPTAAAVAAVPDIQDWYTHLAERQQLLTALLNDRLYGLQQQVAHAERDLEHASPQSLIRQRQQQVDDSVERLQVHMQHALSLKRERFHGLTLQLHSLSPLLTIARGYAVVRRADSQHIISSIEQVQPGEKLHIQVQDGQIPVVVDAGA